jgi:ribosomal protein L12E/L44/L45/RPP1/RPP2
MINNLTPAEIEELFQMFQARLSTATPPTPKPEPEPDPEEEDEPEKKKMFSRHRK